MRSTLVASLSFLSLLSSALSTTVLPPSQDPWYTQPGNISAYAAGDVIRSRSISAELEAFLTLPVNVSVKSVYQYLYRTTDSLGNATASVVTLLEPENSDPTKLLGYQTYYDSANVDSSPSYTLQTGNQTDASSEPDYVLIGAALNLGWWVYTTDYEGLQAQYTAGVQSGNAVLDATRAVLMEGVEVGLSCTPRYALWGYSGGSLAATWAAELQPSYAPELEFAGVAVGGTVPNVSATIQTVNNGEHVGLAFSGIYGQAKAYPNLTQWLDTNLLANKSAEFYAIANGSSTVASALANDQDLFSYFQGGEAAFYDAVPQTVLGVSGVLGLHGTPSAPLFIYKSVGDEVSPVAETDYLVAVYCAEGARIEYHRDLIGDHESEGISGAGDALVWLSDRLGGKSVSEGCSTEVVALLSLSVESLALFGEETFELLEEAFVAML